MKKVLALASILMTPCAMFAQDATAASSASDEYGLLGSRYVSVTALYEHVSTDYGTYKYSGAGISYSNNVFDDGKDGLDLRISAADWRNESNRSVYHQNFFSLGASATCFRRMDYGTTYLSAGASYGHNNYDFKGEYSGIEGYGNDSGDVVLEAGFEYNVCKQTYLTPFVGYDYGFYDEGTSDGDFYAGLEALYWITYNYGVKLNGEYVFEDNDADVFVSSLSFIYRFE